jgi:hypothetical protein
MGGEEVHIGELTETDTYSGAAMGVGVFTEREAR